ncbi:MAG: PD-(D/E)XK nuclease family protein [Lewinellaceae bacterium]|nr:PD-(D/E)XK nuclease family protein [Lewinellaceae bacterium]
MPPEAAPLLYRELVRIAAHPDWRAREQVSALSTLLERLFFEATKQEQLAFSTLFARISYAGHQYQFQPDTLRVIHQFRRVAARVRAGQASATVRDVRLGVQAIAETVLIVCQTAIPTEVLEHLPAEGEWRFDPPDIWDFKARARVVAVRDEPEQECLIAYDDENPGQPVRVRYNLPDRNDSFTPTIRLLRTVFGFPVTLNLLEVDVDAQGHYRPRVFVVEPDYLVDVSAVSECFKADGAQPLAYLVKKFLPYESTPAMLLGNIANHFLDRLLNEPTAPFPDLLRETFRLYPFVYAPMKDTEVREISNKAQKHYLNLKMMAQSGLAQQQIEPENCVLEPTFYSEQYGLQGRLDLFYRTDTRAAIVELKSGSAYRPNSYGISRSHFTQTLLYDLLVRSVFGSATDPAKYILYSGADVQALRFAPTVAPEQWEALQVRNHLVGIERLLTRIRPGDLDVPLLQRLRADKSDSRDFLARDFGVFEAAYGKLSPLEKKYFNAFAGFIAREQWLAKVGEENSDALNGNAALWRSSFSEKQEAFAILSHLEIADNRADQPDPAIVFRKTEKTNPLANFRVGDIAVLYPADSEDDTVLDHQVIKCTIVELGPGQVAVQLRYRQFNLKPFATGSLWNLEPDMLDTGFAAMYRGLFEWASAETGVREWVMTIGLPRVNPTPNPSPKGEGDYIKHIGKDSVEQEKKIGSYDQPQMTTDAGRWKF